VQAALVHITIEGRRAALQAVEVDISGEVALSMAEVEDGGEETEADTGVDTAASIAVKV
jgi:hypothetical protein